MYVLSFLLGDCNEDGRADIKGGHFPFLEHPADTWEGLEDFVNKAWKQSARL
jgi:hypothetical protein